MPFPASRITDMHLCPMVTPAVVPVPHVGGPISGPCVPNVIVSGLPVSVVGDMCVCVGPPDVVTVGSPTVLVTGRPCTRITSNTAHGGVVILGAPTVLVA